MRRISAAAVGLALVAAMAATVIGGMGQGTETARPKITGIAYVRIKITDADADGVFYKRVLRLPQIRSGCFGPDSECLSINLFQQIDLVKVAGPSTGRQIDSVGLFTSDVRGLRLYLQKRGWQTAELKRGSFITSFETQDPEDNRLVFIQLMGEGLANSISGRPPIAARLIHAGFVVRDREKMDSFYKNVLGFHVYWHGGMKEGETNWVDMQVPDGTDWVEYMLGVPADADKRLLGIMNHIALCVPSVKSADEQLENAGVKLTEDPKIGRDGKWQLNLYDPDQTRVELMEFTPTEKPCCSEYTGKHPGP